MEPAPRPPLELLAELPVEEPLDAGVPPREPHAAAAGAPAAPTSAGALEPSEDAEEADLNFTDPELFLAPDDPAAAAPTVPAPRAPAAPAAPPKAVAPQAPRAEAPNLASWTSARASASMTRPAPTPALAPAPASRSPTLKAVASAPAPRATPPSAAAPAPAAPAPTASPPMDRDFIARNQIVERYLSGRLPLKGATDFERLCREHPELLDEIGLPERVNAGLKLLEASGKPEPWQESARPFWQKPQVTLGLAVGVAILGLALVVAWGATVNKDHRIAALEKQAYES